jgi:hypothetical protein
MVGIRVIAMLGHGSEARPPCLDCLGDALAAEKILSLPRECKARRSFVRRVEALSHVVISTPTIGHYLTKDFLNGNDIGIPVIPPDIEDKGYSLEPDESQLEKHNSSSKEAPLKVVHAPSNPRIKGSEIITRVLEKLERDGLIEFKLVIGQTNQQVRETLSNSDLLVDQLYSDIPLPVLASEAAFFGVPTMIGSINWPEITTNFSSDSLPPAIFIHPDNLEEELRNHAINRVKIESVSVLVRSFVSQHRNPRAIASLYEPIILGNKRSYEGIRSIDPKQISYVSGCGSSQEAINQAKKDIHGNSRPCWNS